MDNSSADEDIAMEPEMRVERVNQTPTRAVPTLRPGLRAQQQLTPPPPRLPPSSSVTPPFLGLSLSSPRGNTRAGRGNARAGSSPQERLNALQVQLQSSMQDLNASRLKVRTLERKVVQLEGDLRETKAILIDKEERMYSLEKQLESCQARIPVGADQARLRVSELEEKIREYEINLQASQDIEYHLALSQKRVTELEEAEKEQALKMLRIQHAQKTLHESSRSLLKENRRLKREKRSKIRKETKKMTRGIKREKTVRNFSTLFPTQQRFRLACLHGMMKRVVGQTACKSPGAMRNEVVEVLRSYARQQRITFDAGIMKLKPELDILLCTRARINMTQRETCKSLLLNFGSDILAPTHQVRRLRAQYSSRYKYKYSRVNIQKDQETLSVPVIEMENIREALSGRVQDLFDSEQLSFDGKFEGDLWVCVSGDKGGDKTKVSISIGNVEKANSVQNGMIFAMYTETDSAVMLRAFIPNVVEQINKLYEITVIVDGIHMQVTLKWFLTGDYMFLYACLGLKGPTSKNNCPLCIRPRGAKMSEHEQIYPLRSLEDFEEWSKCGSCGVVTGLKPLFTIIPFENVLLPQMHTVTGVAITTGINPLKLAAVNKDLGKVGVDKMCALAPEQDDENEENGGGMSKGNECQKKLQQVKGQLSVNKTELRETEREKKDGPVIIECLQAIEECRVLAPRKSLVPCQAQPCISQHKRSSALSDKVGFQRGFVCATCKRYQHFACEGLFTMQHIQRVEMDESTICWACSAGRPVTIRERIEEVAKCTEKSKQEEAQLLEMRGKLENRRRAVENIAEKKRGEAQMELDACLRSIGADLQAFGQCLVGNHVQRCLEHPDTLWSLYKDEEQNIAEKSEIMRVMKKISRLSAPHDLTQAEQEELLELIKTFENLASVAFPHQSRTPKIHGLINHVPELVARYGSWAFFSDQPVEALHQEEKRRAKQYAPIRNEELRWRAELADFAVMNALHDKNKW